jgi:hypothetical protein
VQALVYQGILPVCGAVLPKGPQTKDSQCRETGRLNASDLHLDHEPPLSDHERSDAHAVCDPTRVQLLCFSCHTRKTLRDSHRLHLGPNDGRMRSGSGSWTASLSHESDSGGGDRISSGPIAVDRGALV